MDTGIQPEIELMKVWNTGTDTDTDVVRKTDTNYAERSQLNVSDIQITYPVTRVVDIRRRCQLDTVLLRDEETRLNQFQSIAERHKRNTETMVQSQTREGVSSRLGVVHLTATPRQNTRAGKEEGVHTVTRTLSST